MSFSDTFWPGIPPRSNPPCPASITTVVGELSPLAPYERHARKMISRPAPNKEIREKFLRITGRLLVRPADAPKVLVPCFRSSAQPLRRCHHAPLFRRYPNEQGGAAFWFP